MFSEMNWSSEDYIPLPWLAGVGPWNADLVGGIKMDSPIPLMAYDPFSSEFIDVPSISQACQHCSVDQPFVLAVNCTKHSTRSPRYNAPPPNPPPASNPVGVGGAAASSNFQEGPEKVSPAEGNFKASSCGSAHVRGGDPVNPKTVPETDSEKFPAAAHSTNRVFTTRVDSKDPMEEEKSAGNQLGKKKRQRPNVGQKSAASAESSSGGHSGGKGSGSAFRSEKICKTAKQVSSSSEEPFPPPFHDTGGLRMPCKNSSARASATVTTGLGEPSCVMCKSAKAVREHCNPSFIPFGSNGGPSMNGSAPAAHAEAVKTSKKAHEGPGTSTANVGEKIVAEDVDRKRSANEEAKESSPSFRASFSLEMKQSNVVSGFFLSIPSTFSKQFLPHEESWVILEDENGCQWRTKYLARRSGLSAGWRRLVIDKRFGVGDTISFIMQNPKHLHFCKMS